MNQTPKSAGRKLALFVVLTVVWLGVAICLGYTARHPDASCAGTFSCLTASEWGDFLAGVFAPIAFLWLVAAVWIQSDELREQRKELALTRKEFELNRSVMEQQAEEARKQAEYIAAQTKLLTEESNLRKLSIASEQFNSLIEKYIRYVMDHYTEIYKRFDGDGHARFFHVSDSDYSEEQFINMNYLYICVKRWNQEFEIRITDFRMFENAFVYIYSAEKIVNDLPYDSRIFWRRSRISELVGGYCGLIMNEPQLEHLREAVLSRECRLGTEPDDFVISSEAQAG